MTSPTDPTPSPSDSSVLEPASIANLTASLRADYLALHNDVEQAQELAADFQRQLAGKSNEVAHFKALLEKTTQDLGRMETHVAELRAERHRLANEVMIAAERREALKDVAAERDQFRREVEALRSALTSSSGEFQERIKLQEMEITRLRAALEGLRSRPALAPRPSGDAAAGVHDRITELSATVERLESIIRERPGAKTGDEFIDISFDS